MFDKYVVVNDTKILCGQNATTGAWYCKELPAQTIKEADKLIGDMNKILNKHNKGKPVRENKKNREVKTS